MCGIAGLYAYRESALAPDRNELRRIRDHMIRRGPDGCGEWFAADQRVALAHRRLSIIDLSARARQPMSTRDGRLTISYNGEIYNYRALRQRLENQGWDFHSDSDTEVLLQLYADQGVAMLSQLRGMFAFALWDAREREMLLARDPYGIKPLYYADAGGLLRVASQVKALLAGGGVATDIDPCGASGFFLFGSVPEPHTLYRDIKALPAGSFMRIGRYGLQPPQRYFSLTEVYADACRRKPYPKLDVMALQGAIREALLDSVRHHLVADVPVGAFLSAGVDSGALLGLMRDAGQRRTRALTLAFAEFRDQHRDEAPLAAQVAERYGAEHSVRVVSKAEFQADLPKILEAMDQPSIDGVNTWFVSKAAHELGLKVVVSGLGGDELFGGYPSFRSIPNWRRGLRWTAGLPVAKLFRWCYEALGASLNPKGAGLLEYGGSYAGAYLLKRGLFMPWELQRTTTSEVLREGLQRLLPLDYLNKAVPEPGNAFAKIAALEGGVYLRNQLLRDTDWAGMAHSLEIRLPLVDAFLVRRLAPLLVSAPGLNGKRLLAHSPRLGLPGAVLERPKSGFETPLGAWLESLPRDARPGPLKQDPRWHWSRRWGVSVYHRYSAPPAAPTPRVCRSGIMPLPSTVRISNMVTAVVLINAQRGRVNAVAEQLAETKGISEVYSVGGRYDLVAIIRVADNEAMAQLVTTHLANLSGIAHTETLLAFQSFSRHDLDAMFSIGN